MRWVPLGLMLVVIAMMLATAAALEGDGDEPLPRGQPVLREQTGPVIDPRGDTLRSGRPPADVVGLGIVGVPDARTTEEVLRLMAAHDVAATWFVSGEEVAEQLSVIRQLATRHEIAVTGYRGDDLRGLPAWRARLSLSVTQSLLAARLGVTSPLLTLPATPYSHLLDGASLAVARDAAERGYLLVAGTPPSHARGGDVTLLVADLAPTGLDASLRALLRRAELDGLSIRPVGEAVGIEADQVNPPASAWVRFNGWLVLGAALVSDLVARGVSIAFYPVTALIVLRSLLTLVLGWRHAHRPAASTAWRGRVAVVVPAYNEAAGIEATVRSLAASTWEGELEIIVVDDGSSDGTAEIVESLEVEGLTLIRQANTGKPGALNTGIAASTGEVIVLVDGDTVFEPTTITYLVAPFSDSRVGAVSGNAKVANRTRLLGRWQHIEYVMGFNLDRRLLDELQAITTVPGAIGAFRREALEGPAPVSDDTIAEDTDLTIAVGREGWRVVHRADAIAWTEAPSSVNDLWKQRYRWSYGVLQSVWKHRRAMIEPAPVGRIGLSYTLVFQVVVGLAAPVVDVAAVFALATGDQAILATWAGFTAAQLVLAVVAFRLDGESLKALWALPLQQVFYRQMMYLVVVQSVLSAAAGVRLRWHSLRRIGIEQVAPR